MRVPQEQEDRLHGSQPDRGTYIELVQAQMNRRPQLLRATTDVGPRSQSPNPPSTTAEENDENWELRHGWESEYNSEEYLNRLNSVSLIIVSTCRRY